MLEKFDANEAAKTNAREWPRIRRAIEFYLQTGEKISSHRPLRPSPPDVATRLRVFALSPPRAELYERINQRTDEHFANGLVDEVRGLLDQGVPGNTSALGAHGYRRVVEYFEGKR